MKDVLNQGGNIKIAGVVCRSVYNLKDELEIGEAADVKKVMNVLEEQ
ncbi:hypothetical protein [Cohnella terricola]|nr:hypothetical protein [Cohnella terricola]